MVYLCYIDESGTSIIPGNSNHYVLGALSIPIAYWKMCDGSINKIKKKYRIENAEVHTAWMLRKYLEQTKIPNFESLNDSHRRIEVEKLRTTYIIEIHGKQLPVNS
jgi:hypothetical protein